MIAVLRRRNLEVEGSSKCIKDRLGRHVEEKKTVKNQYGDLRNSDMWPMQLHYQYGYLPNQL